MTTIKQALALANDGKLSLSYGGQPTTKDVVVPKSKGIVPPTLKLSGAVSKGPFAVICIDLDAPYASLPVLSPILHLFTSGFTAGSDGVLQKATEAPQLDWTPVAPPPLSGPHRYVFVVFEQPATFDEEKLNKEYPAGLGLAKRARVDVDGLVQAYGLTNMVAAEYMISH